MVVTVVWVDLCSCVAKDGVVCVNVFGDSTVDEISSVGVAVDVFSTDLLVPDCVLAVVKENAVCIDSGVVVDA